MNCSQIYIGNYTVTNKPPDKTEVDIFLAAFSIPCSLSATVETLGLFDYSAPTSICNLSLFHVISSTIF